MNAQWSEVKEGVPSGFGEEMARSVLERRLSIHAGVYIYVFSTRKSLIGNIGQLVIYLLWYGSVSMDQ